jgi:Activator of Hsp90 ATPase homolog 1-like protein
MWKRRSEMTVIPAVRREVLVRTHPERAFALFTEHVAKWWPLASHSVFGASATVAFEDDQLVERLGDQASVWAEVLEWAPPHVLRLAWHPGHPKERATDLTIRFTSEGEQTLVSLEHLGWERLEEPEAASENYRSGWVVVLAAFESQVSGQAPAS